MKIKICIINAGVMNIGKFSECSSEQLVDMIDVNCYQYAMMSKICFKYFQNKEDKQAIILVSSTVGWKIWPGITLFSATKAFTTYLTGILYFSNKLNCNLDIQGYCPIGVSTNILEQMKNPIIYISSKMACMSSLSELALYSKTSSFVYKNIWTTGHWYHELQVISVAFLNRIFPGL